MGGSQCSLTGERWEVDVMKASAIGRTGVVAGKRGGEAESESQLVGVAGQLNTVLWFCDWAGRNVCAHTWACVYVHTRCGPVPKKDIVDLYL